MPVGLLVVISMVAMYTWVVAQERRRRSADLSTRPSSRLLVQDKRKLSGTTRRAEDRWDVIVVGAGVAGGALGAALSRSYNTDGWNKKKKLRVLILERSLQEPNRIVGELLQPGGKDQLNKMGIPDALEGFDAQTITGYVMMDQKGGVVKVEYPADAKGAPSVGAGLHNGRFLTKLRKLCGTSPIVELRQGTVTKLLHDDNKIRGVVYKTKDGKTKDVRAPLTVVADGCFSILRKPLVREKFKVTSHFLGLLLKDCKLPAQGHGHVLLANPSPILVYPVSSTEARMLIDFPGQIPDKASGALDAHLRETVLPQLPPQLHESFLRALDEKTSIQSMPNRRMRAAAYSTPGVVLLGDSLNMRHPLTGGGMTVALTDVNTLLRVLENTPRERLGAEVGPAFYKARSKDNSTINILADALYQVFRVENKDLRSACFAYLAQGGKCSQDPVKLLAGMSRDQWLLLRHFWSVAIFGVARELLPLPTPSAVVRACGMLKDASRIIVPLIRNEM